MNDASSLNSALANPNITKVTLGANIPGNFTINRPVEIDLAGKNMSGTLNFTYNNTGMSKLSNSGAAASVNTVNVNTKNASFEQSAGVTVTNLNIIEVKPGTYTNEGTVGTVTITDADARFLNNGTTTKVNVNSSGTVILGGTKSISTVVVQKAGTLNVEAGTTVTALTVDGSANGAAINNAGTVNKVTANAPVIVTGNAPTSVEGSASEGVVVSAVVDSEETLKAALAKDFVSNILIGNNIELDSQLAIERPVTIKGNGNFTISAAEDFKVDEANKPWSNLVSVDGVNGKVTLEDLIIEKSKRSGINIFESTDVVLKNVTSRNNAAAGMIVTNSKVNADNFNTSGNIWYGVNVDNGSNPSANAPKTVFTITSGVLSEKAQIVTDKGNVEINATGYTVIDLTEQQ